MGKVDLKGFADAETLAAAVAEDLGELLRSAKGTNFSLALSGGRIARLLFQEIVRAVEKSLFATTHFFWADERCVPPEDPESNYALANRELLRPLAVGEKQVHRVRGELEPKTAAELAADDLRHSVPADATGWPALDLVFLGMGEDGHVASLFPGEPSEVGLERTVYRPVIASKPPPRRITLDYGTIVAAGQVWALVSGPGKEQALRASLGFSQTTPLGRVLEMRTATRVLTDIPGVKNPGNS